MFEGAEFYFNVDHGYLEGLVRGCKASLLTQQDYINLVQCETLEGTCCSSHHLEREKGSDAAHWKRGEGTVFPWPESPGQVLIPRVQISGVHELG